ncbi:MAG: Serine/threonine-protein kinase [Vezdaea aestivalis]|nr:MAG: Serine/threonine-protein kinase [Vezdaea aestivalis]
MTTHHDSSAADLLRQAMGQSRQDDEHHDQIGSGSMPGSGVTTPRPDPSDKRLPGIMHSYFGQVRDSFSSRLASIYITQTPPLKREALGPSPGPSRNRSESWIMIPNNAPRPSSSKGVEAPGSFHEYPTPPTSGPPSERGERSSGNISRNASRTPSNSSTKAREMPVAKLAKIRKGTFDKVNVDPLRTVVTDSTVSARHLSNPCKLSTAPGSASPTLLAKSSTSCVSLRKLTSSVVETPPKKNTPPETPRSLSNEGSHHEKSPLAPTSQPVLPGVPQASAQGAALSGAATPETTGMPSAAGSIRPPKGKMSVIISEGRGLQPCRDPYVVCVFEWNEYISKGPKKRLAVEGPDDGDGAAPRAIAMKRSASENRAMAIPMKSRQSSGNGFSDVKDSSQLVNPKWDHEATFDVVGNKSEIDVCVYDRSNSEAFLGHVRICPLLIDDGKFVEGWFELTSRGDANEHVSGEIFLKMKFSKTDKKHFGPDDFQVLKLIGKGTFGQVYQVRKKDTQRIYAMKVLSKKVIVQKKEVAHTLGERNILVRTAMEDSPFIVALKFSFQTPTDLYLVTDYMSGGELFWHLQKEGRFNEQRAKFYIAELILALEHLHKHDIVYRDLKPENILLDANGHIALCDFGLSKANLTKGDTTNTFCGTTEYLAPEVLLDEQGYTKMVDFWSLGVLVFEMCCGWSPFYAEDTQQMYKNIAFGKVRFPRDALSTEGRNFVKGLLNRNPHHRLGATSDAEELKAHAFFADIDWDALIKKNIVTPFKPKLKSVLDTSNFDPEFTNALNGASSLNARTSALINGNLTASTPLSPGMQANFKGFTFVDESLLEKHLDDRYYAGLDTMDETEDDINEFDRIERGGKGDRMSGIVKTHSSEEGFFNNDNFDIET